MNPYAIIAVLVAFIGTALGGVHVGKRLEREVHQKAVLSLSQKHVVDLTAEVEKRERQRKFDETIARKASQDYEMALDKNKRDYDHDVAALRRAGGLRFASPCPRPTLAAASESAGARRFDEARAAAEKLPDQAEDDLQALASIDTIRLPQAIEDGLFKLVEDADAMAEQLRALQKWVKDAGHYGDPPP